MKKIYIFVLLLSILGINAEPDNKEPLYHLMPHTSRDGKDHFINIKIYAGPSEDAKIIAEVEHNKNDAYNFVTSFPEGKEPYSYHVLTSSKKVGDFYRVYYKKEYSWVKEEDFAKVYTYEEYFKELRNTLSIYSDKEIELYKEIDGERLPWSTVSKHKNGEYPGFNIPVEEFKRVDDKIWLRIAFGKSTGDHYDFILEKPIYFWIRAYKDNGKVNNWFYSSKYFFRWGR